jgi:GNAT superfamily N-acetyltransferase
MNPIEPPLVAAPGLTAAELTLDDEPWLQRFFDENPLYFQAVHGEPARPDEAHEEIAEALPAGWPYTKKWVIGYRTADGPLAAMANVVSDLLAPSVWHVGTFIVATDRHGQGDAQQLYQGLEDWARRQGAQWMRLGVVSGNARAERFWLRQGFTQTRLRTGVVMGQRTNTLRVMCKPLAGGTLQDYLARVVRDRPEPEAEAAGRPG